MSQKKEDKDMLKERVSKKALVQKALKNTMKKNNGALKKLSQR